jgi:RNA recognition motif-containing protein
MTLYIDGLHPGTRSVSIRATLFPEDEVRQCRLATDPETGRSLCYAIVELADDCAEDRAISRWQNMEFDGRIIRLRKATPEECAGRDDNRSRDNNRGRAGADREDRRSEFWRR